ncbi:Adenylate cyclase, germination specific, partial [Armadillidium nasatum]
KNLYHQSYNRIGVLFASIPNYHEFYTELDVNNQGKECLRLLNEIISDFDQLLDEERFKSVDKIKTVGSAYMAAVGLMPEMRIKDNDDDSAGFYMSTLVELAFAFREKLGVINADSYNNFSLKVGLNIGPVVAGVIGARKPQYDIWGNTVNVASRMESTGLINHIQVTEDVYNVLKNFPYEFQCRGKIKVKGKGDMTTYFITDRKPITSDISSVPPQIPPHKQPLGNICGGVPTPLSYLPSKNSLQSHSFARPTNLQELNLQISSSREASRNCKVHCYPDQGLCSEPKKVMNKVSHKCLQSNEQEPLLQSVGNSIASACHQPRKERIEVPFSCSDSLQMQHQILSSHCERQHRNAPPSRNNNICCQPKSKALPPDLNFDLEPYWQKHECFHENIKEPIYRGIRAKELKCLDRRKHLNNPLYKGMPNTGKGLVLPQFPQYPHVEEAGIRHKLRNFTRHHSDESLHGSSHKEIYSSRIHSSFDELSSANRSPSLSSSDESFSRTDFSRTDQDSPSPQNTPSLYEEQMKYLCNDSDLLENLGINFKDAFFPDDINKRSSDETSLCLNNLNSMIFTPSWKDAKENNRDNLQKMRRDDVFIPKFSPYIIQDRSKKNKVKSESESKTLPESRHGHNVVSHLKTEVGPRHSLAEEKITSVTSGSESFSRIQSLDKSSRESGMVTPESVIMMPRKRSLTREDYLSNSSRKYSSSQKSLGERLNVESDYDNEPQSLGKVSPKKEWLELEKISDSSQDIKKNKIGSLDRLETKSNSLSGDEKSLEGYNSLQKLIKLQEKHLSIVDECSEKLGLHFDPSKNHKILQLKPISTTVSELPGNKESQNIHPMKDKQEYNLPEEERLVDSEFNEKLKNKHEVEKTKNNFECEAEDGASLMPYSDHPLTDEEDIRTFEEVEQRLADESKEKIKISSKERNFESKKETDGNETSQSEWSEDDDGAASEPLLDRESTGGYTTDDAALEQVSVMNEAGLTDAEGALSDVNSLYNDPQHYDGDMDDTSMSSRASSHIFDNDALITFDSLNAYCDSELDVRHFGAPVPDGFDTEALSDVDLDSSIDPFANMSDMRNIRSVSASITKNFGQPRPDTDDGESDV